MSRIRIVGGTITKTTGGDYNIYSDGNIVYNSGTAVAETSDTSIVYGEPKDTPEKKIVSKIKVEFRPNIGWEGEFGFDWARTGDSQMPVDVPYSSIIGKYGSVYATDSKAVFTFDNALYQKKLLEYESFLLVDFGKYYVPNMTLMIGETAILDASIEVLEKPDSMRYKYDESIFEVLILEKLSNKEGKHYNDKVIQIKCLKEFSAKQKIELIATKDKINTRIGQINLLPNNVVKELDVLFIPVKHNGTTGAVKGNEMKILSNAFKQAYIKGNIQQYTSYVEVGGWWFDLFFTTKDKKGNKILDRSDVRSLHSALDSAFFDDDANEIYKDHYRLYMMSNGTINGEAEAIGNAKTVVVFQGRNDSTAPHELMHAMGLYHTFDNDGKFTYKLHKTDNIMDYTHQTKNLKTGKQNERFSTNKWQWKILNKKM